MSRVGFAHQRVAVLIDEVNLYCTAVRLFGNARVDWVAVLERLSTREIVRMLFYCIKTPENNLTVFERKFSDSGIEIKTKPVKVFSDQSRKGNWDVGMVLDAVELATKVDVLVLVTGDSDFEDLVHYLHARSVKVELMAFRQQVAAELLACVDEFIPITEHMIIKRRDDNQPTSKLELAA